MSPSAKRRVFAMIVAAAAAFVGWVYLLFFRGGFWRADQRLPPGPPSFITRPPAVAVVIPARNEAATIAAAVRSLLAQDFPGRLDLIVVDDNSSDGTGALAEAAACNEERTVTVVAAPPPPAGWTGKLNAVAIGLREARQRHPEAEYVLLADADILDGRTTVARLVAKAEAEGLDLVSLMARLRCESAWEKLLVPAFIFYFQKLYPFPWVNDPRRPEAAAAGGCMLVRRRALEAAGGIAAIRGRLIDDCALAVLVKRRGRIWLGLSDDVQSLRPYGGLPDFWRMVARTAFTQLTYSWYRLVMAVAMMMLLYAVPPLALLVGTMAFAPAPALLGAAALLLMMICVRPTLQLYGLPVWRGALLPAAGVLFTAMTVDSARRHAQGRGGLWKGRRFIPSQGKGRP